MIPVHEQNEDVYYRRIDTVNTISTLSISTLLVGQVVRVHTLPSPQVCVSRIPVVKTIPTVYPPFRIIPSHTTLQSLLYILEEPIHTRHPVHLVVSGTIHIEVCTGGGFIVQLSGKEDILICNQDLSVSCPCSRFSAFIDPSSREVHLLTSVYPEPPSSTHTLVPECSYSVDDDQDDIDYVELSQSHVSTLTPTPIETDTSGVEHMVNIHPTIATGHPLLFDRSYVIERVESLMQNTYRLKLWNISNISLLIVDPVVRDYDRDPYSIDVKAGIYVECITPDMWTEYPSIVGSIVGSNAVSIGGTMDDTEDDRIDVDMCGSRVDEMDGMNDGSQSTVPACIQTYSVYGSDQPFMRHLPRAIVRTSRRDIPRTLLKWTPPDPKWKSWYPTARGCDNSTCLTLPPTRKQLTKLSILDVSEDPCRFRSVDDATEMECLNALVVRGIQPDIIPDTSILYTSEPTYAMHRFTSGGLYFPRIRKNIVRIARRSIIMGNDWMTHDVLYRLDACEEMISPTFDTLPYNDTTPYNDTNRECVSIHVNIDNTNHDLSFAIILGLLPR